MSGHVRNVALAGWAALSVALLAVAAVVELREVGAAGDWPWGIGLMAFPVAAALLLMKRPGNGVGRALGVVGMTAAAIFALGGVDEVMQLAPATPLSRQTEAVANALVMPMWGGMIALLYLFPTGRPLNARHGRVLAVFMWMIAGLAVLQLIRPGPLADSGRVNPFGFGPDWTRPVFEFGLVVLPLSALVGIGSLIMRWRRAGATEQAQLRWFLCGAVAVLALLVIISQPEGPDTGIATIAVRVFVAIGLWGLPAAIVVAITRYRLYEIDRLVSRTVSYAVVVGALAAVYAGGVFLLSSLLPLESDLAVAASTLLVAALFNPLRRRVQQRVDRRFNRPRFDAGLEVERFAGRVRTDLDLDDLTADLLGVVVRTVQPSTASMWMRRDPGRAPGRPRSRLVETTTS
jgi:hypothetical protein